MDYPKGLTCGEHFCRYHREDVCTGYDYQWPDCPRAIRARLAALERAGDDVAKWVEETFKGDGSIDWANEMKARLAAAAWRAARGSQ